MRNFKLILFLFILTFTTNVFASGAEVNITFTLYETPYTTVTKRIEGDTTVFNLTNKLLSINLTPTILKEILQQKSGSGASPLTLYETLNISVTPIEDTAFDPLVGKTEYYRASSAGSWVSRIDANISMAPTAEIKPMSSDFWPYGYAISYRNNISEGWRNTVPNGVDLSNKTMEEKLAILLNIDLNANPNGVVDAYEELFYFRVLPSGYNYKTRFDFYSKKEGVTPELKLGSTTEYLTDSLQLLDSQYVYISYDKEESNETMLTIIPDKEKINIWALGGFLLFTTGTLVVFKKYSKKAKRHV